MAVAIVFEPHSTTTDNQAGVATGWLDGQLPKQGRTLARALGRRRRNDGVAAVFASDPGRAIETAELAFAGSAIPVYLDAAARMRRRALDHLLTGAALQDLVAAPFAWQEGWSYALPGGWQRPGLMAGFGDP